MVITKIYHSKSEKSLVDQGFFCGRVIENEGRWFVNVLVKRKIISQEYLVTLKLRSKGIDRRIGKVKGPWSLRIIVP